MSIFVSNANILINGDSCHYLWERFDGKFSIKNEIKFITRDSSLFSCNCQVCAVFRLFSIYCITTFLKHAFQVKMLSMAEVT